MEKKKSRHKNFDLSNYMVMEKNLNIIKPYMIINLLALTNVDKCEKDISEALNLNVKILKNLNQYLKTKNYKIKFIHISTDQVYSGNGPHKEENSKPINNYGLTKLLGELNIIDTKALILRTNFVGRSETPNRESLTDWFINNLKRKKKINLYKDIYFNPLEINYLVSLILKIMNKKISGTFNLGSKGSLNKSAFLLKIANQLDLSIDSCKVINSVLSKKKAPRPKDMVMSCKKFEKSFRIKLPKLSDQIIKISNSYLN